MSSISNTTTALRTRLYISPLSPSLLSTILPPSVQRADINASYHLLDTFPANNYGYIDLLTDEAQKLRTKFNGAFLKGMKVRVEEARLDKKRKARDEDLEQVTAAAAAVDEGAEHVGARVTKKAKREKHKHDVLPAIEIPGNREVKRGWVQSANNKEEKQHKSKNKTGKAEKKSKSEKSQMLFRTTLPPNIASKTSAKAEVKKEKSSKELKEHRKGRSKGRKEVEVKEFTKTTKYPTFLRSNQTAENGDQASEFVDGIGWVGADGRVLETVSTRSTQKKEEKPKRSAKFNTPISEDDAERGREESGNPAEEISRTNDTEAPHEVLPTPVPVAVETSNATVIPSTNDHMTSSKVVIDEVSAMTPKTTMTPSPVPARDVHPLEALFKRQPPTSTTSANNQASKPTPTRPAPILTSFSFFGNDSNNSNTHESDDGGVTIDMDDAVSELHPPQTPFMQRDMQFRGQRSAAPTPDTAAVGKKMGVPWLVGGLGEEDGSDDDPEGTDVSYVTTTKKGEQKNEQVEEETSPLENSTNIDSLDSVSGTGGDADGAVGQGEERSDFEKHFWEHRGEYNRGWKARKRDARKEVRQSENRRSG